MKWVEINREYAKKWPVITKKKAHLADAKDFDGMPNKFEKLFDPRPAKQETQK
jgi:ferredoxin